MRPSGAGDLALFPPLQSKCLQLELSYQDSLVVRVTIEGDADMQAAFAEESILTFIVRGRV